MMKAKMLLMKLLQKHLHKDNPYFCQCSRQLQSNGNAPSIGIIIFQLLNWKLLYHSVARIIEVVSINKIQKAHKNE